MHSRVLPAAMVLSLLMLVSASAEAADTRVPQSLLAQASAHGSARVIVRLNTPFSPEAALMSAPAAAAQRQGIAAVRGSLQAQLAGSRHTVVRAYGALPFLALEAGPDALARLQALPGLVLSVDEDRISRPQLAETISVIQAPAAWAAGFDGTGTIVALLDTGVEKTHPFLTDKVIAEACFSSNTTYEGHTVTSLCPGGVTFSSGPGSALNCDAAIFNCDNGTHVAGVVAGGTTGASPAGVAPGASLMSVQIYSRFPGAYSGCGGVDCTLSFASDQIAGLNYVFEQRNAFPGKTIAAANLGLGGGVFTAPCELDPIVAPIAQLRTAGIATVISTANDGLTDAMGSPACAPGAISVGATDDGSHGTTVDDISFYSNMASFMSLLAPGSWTRSSVPTTTDPSGFATFGGTSVATAHVSGAFAILRGGNPTASVDTLLEVLQSAGRPLTDDRPVCPTCTTTGVTSHRIAIKDALDVVAIPDVAMTAASTVAAASPGQAIVVNGGVTNEGPLAVGPFIVRYYLSADAVLDAGVDVHVGGRTVRSLAPGATNVVPETVTIPIGTAAGSYRIIVVADATGVLAESDEGNNARATAPVVVGLDLAVTVATTVTAASPGQAIVVNATIRNIGSVDAGTFTVKYKLSADTTFDAGDVPLGARTVTSLAAGAQNVTPKTVTIPVGTPPGVYRVVVRADANGVLAEASESNNVKATKVIVVGPDVTVTAASTVGDASAGDAIVVNATIRNTGSAAGPFVVRYLLSADNVVGGGDVLLARRTVQSLAAGSDNVAPKTVTIPLTTSSGSYRILVVADSEDVLAEGNEGNNVRPTAAITIGP
jgi:subtilisin